METPRPHNELVRVRQARVANSNSVLQANLAGSAVEVRKSQLDKTGFLTFTQPPGLVKEEPVAVPKPSKQRQKTSSQPRSVKWRARANSYPFPR